MRKDKAAYKLCIRTKEKENRSHYSDSLNDALMNKDMDSFWKSWRSKFGCKSSAAMIDGIFDDTGSLLLISLPMYLSQFQYLIL